MCGGGGGGGGHKQSSPLMSSQSSDGMLFRRSHEYKSSTDMLMLNCWVVPTVVPNYKTYKVLGVVTVLGAARLSGSATLSGFHLRGAGAGEAPPPPPKQLNFSQN